MVSLAAWYRMTEINETSSITNTGIVNIALKAFSPCTAIVLNSLAIHALIRTSSLTKPTKTLLLSLAMSDLSVGLVSQPLFIARILRQSFTSVYFISLVFQTALARVSFFGVSFECGQTLGHLSSSQCDLWLVTCCQNSQFTLGFELFSSSSFLSLLDSSGTFSQHLKCLFYLNDNFMFSALLCCKTQQKPNSCFTSTTNSARWWIKRWFKILKKCIQHILCVFCLLCLLSAELLFSCLQGNI